MPQPIPTLAGGGTASINALPSGPHADRAAPAEPQFGFVWRNAMAFVRRHALALGLIVASGTWAAVTGVWYPDSITDLAQAAIEFSVSTGIALIAITVSVRSDRVKAAQASAILDLESRRRILGAAIEQTVESVVICDVAGTIVYVNPAFERTTGYTAPEVIGRNPRLLQSGEQSPAFYGSMWATLNAGRPWMGELVNRRKDGRTYRDEATITPMLDDGGRVVAYVAVQRDVTHVRELESNLVAITEERAAIGASLAALPTGESLESTAAAICGELVRLPHVDFAALCSFDGPKDVVVVATAGIDMPPGLHLPPARANAIRSRAALGTWTEQWRDLPGDDVFGAAIQAAGGRLAALSPIGNGVGQVGILLIGALSADHAAHLVERLPALVEFAATSHALVGAKLVARRDELALQTRIRSMIDRKAFHPVYQAIVELESKRPIGFEALTRFDDGTPPDEVFAAAMRTGLGHELEAATLDAAVRCSATLPVGTWLSLNASPAFTCSGGLATVLTHRTRPVVVEITEHNTIADYAAIREVIAALGPDIRVAVDDAGAGVANFSHIVELRPAYVKVDVSLIRDINVDVTRQALLVGLLHFARTSDRRLIAEGVETVEELATLRSLDVHYGQGYLLGRPTPAPAQARVTPVPATRQAMAG
jgi:PAS domain S-box-containing protein